MSDYGTGNPRFIHTGTSLDFTPTTHCIMTKKEPLSQDIIRQSTVTTDNKYFEIGSHLEMSYRIYNLTKAQIDALEAVIGETIDFYPHSDVGSGFKALVTNVQPKMEKNLAYLYYVDITVLSVNYFTFNTNITITSPNGSEVYQRNQVITITWTSNNIVGNVALELWKNGSKLSDIDTSEANDGSYSWTVPADATIGSDYKIKIVTVGHDGLIYDLSDANFEIEYDGYYLFDGSNDEVIAKSTLTTLGDEKSFAFYYNRLGTAISANKLLFGSYKSGKREEIYFLNESPDCIRYNVASGTGVNTVLFNTNSAIPFDDAWHTIVINVKHSTASAEIWIDGVKDTLDIVVSDTGYIYNSADANYPYKLAPLDAMKIKQFRIYSQLLDATDIANFHAGNISSITKLGKMFWVCNEADTGAPYTNKTIDNSGNANHGTPTNITGATFFNQS